MNPLISIVIPVYNAEKHLARCLDSVLAQIYDPVEIVLVNDGSKDESLAICRRYADRHEQILVIDQENQGPGVARKVGFNASHGEYVMFVDADDTVADDICAVLMRVLLEDGSDVVQCNFSLVWDEQKPTQAASCMKKTYEADECLAAYATSTIGVSLCGKLIRKDILSSDDFADLCYAEDAWVTVWLCARASRISIISLNLYHYFQRHRVSGAAMRRRFDPRKFDQLKVVVSFHDLYAQKAPGLLPHARRAICSMALHLYAEATCSSLPERKEMLAEAKAAYYGYYRRSDYRIAVSGMHSAIKNILFHISPRLYAAVVNSAVWERLKVSVLKRHGPLAQQTGWTKYL